MTTVAKRRYTPDEYLALERAAEFRSEYADGQIYAMGGASRRHNTIALNLAAELRAKFGDGPCEAFMADMRVKVEATGLFTYPDVVAVCGKPVLEDETHLDTLLNPTLIIEVLSQSTEAYDRGKKFEHYRRIPSLQEYVLVAQREVHVDRYMRRGDFWAMVEFTDPEGMLPLESVGCSIALRDIYRRVDFESPGD